MIFSITCILVLIVGTLSAIHFYWALGGKWGISATIPTNEKGERVLNPKSVDCIVVSIALLAVGLLVLIEAQLIPLSLPAPVRQYGLPTISGIFILRAIGDFKYVGFFKKIKNTSFGKLDTRYYSPLCLFIGLLTVLLNQFKPE